MSLAHHLDLSLYIILDPDLAGGRSIAVLAHEAVKGGATVLQYRAKNRSTREMVRDIAILRSAIRQSPIRARNVPLLVNDRVDVALASGADGVHLGRDDMDPQEARRLLGPTAIIGATIKNQADVEALGAAVDYACIGGVFATSSKTNPEPPVGLEGFRALRAAIAARFAQLPVGAIAGIDGDNAGSVIKAGADGIAVISAFSAAADPAAAARHLKTSVEAARAERQA